MTEPDYKAIVKKYLPDRQLEDEQPSLDVTADSFELAKEFLEKVKPIIETRNKIKKSSDELVAALAAVIVKLDALIKLKNVNAEQEKEVLSLLKQELMS